MSLKYYSRSDVPPTGKQKVYLSGTKTDVEAYGKRIADQILLVNNCVIWYSDFSEPLPSLGDYLDDISLFVFIASREFLSEENHARNTELAYVTKRGIPVLPILKDKEVNNLFFEVIGTTQYLYLEDTDATADTVQLKLKKLLNSLLVNTEMEKAIRENFRSRIFLSYRKKDRAHARELLETIHSDERLQDVCIWFDEYLVPGEDYTDAIGEQMKQSDLVIVMVTPSVLEEGNYVMEHEFPDLVKMGKNYLAVEMADTDREELDRCFGFPAVINGHDRKAVSDAVSTALGKTETCLEPSHLGLVGCAFLTGTETEVNHELGKKLVTEAAGKDDVTSIDVLIDMYKRGQYEEKADPEKAVFWETRIIEQVKNGKKSLKFTDDNELYARMVELGDDLLVAGQRDAAFQVFYDLGNITYDESENSFSVDATRYYATAMEILGDLFLVRGELREAAISQTAAMGEREKLLKLTDDYEDLRLLGMSYFKYAQLLLNTKDKAAAKMYAVRCVILFEDEYRKTNNAVTRKDMAASYRLMGAVSAAFHDKKEAIRCLSAAAKLYTQNIEEEISVDALRDLLGCLIQKRDLEGMFAALVTERQMIAAYEKLYKRSRNLDDCYDYGQLLYKHANLERNRNLMLRAMQVASFLCTAAPGNKQNLRLYKDCEKKINKFR